ncbi:MAG: MarR family transcriptional regulator [Spirochaetales bacterium]|nr:MarR family transcriptional regulator [Spirochaetales bacterium]
MNFKDRVLLLNDHFFKLYQSRFFQEKKTCSNSPIALLNYNDLRFLECLDRNDILTMRALAESLSLPMSTLTSIANKLVKNKYIDRLRIDEDRRVVQVKLTNLGRKMINLRKNAHTSVSEELLKSLTESEQKEFLRLFKKAIG